MSVVDSIKTTVQVAPGGYLVAWLVGVPVEKWAAFAALVWTLWLIFDKGLAKWRARKLKHRRGAIRKRRRVVERVIAARESDGK